MSFIDWSDFPRLLSEVSSLSLDGLVVIDDASWNPTSLKDSNDCEDSPIDDQTSFVVCPDIVGIYDDAMHSSSSVASLSKTSTSSPTSSSKRVSFSTVEVREYSLTIGEHPSCKDGLPITLDWHYNEESTVLDVVRLNQTQGQHSSNFIKKLNYQERLHRLQLVTGISEKHLLLVRNRRAWSRGSKEL